MKTQIIISNLEFKNNNNNNKFKCGSIHFCNKLNITIDKSNFINNNCKNNGGAICIDNILDLNITLNSNTFIKNKAINGGALYIMNGINNNLEDVEEYKSDIIIENNSYENNVAENFGGAVYSNFNKLYNAKLLNNVIKYNTAGINGGGLYSPDEENKIFNLSQTKFENNTVNSYLNNYSSRPSYILLNRRIKNKYVDITTGDVFPLSFTLYDAYDNVVKDITKYYSSLNIKILLVKKDNNNNNNNNNNNLNVNKTNKKEYNIKGNICFFSNGHCKLNNLQIFAKPNTYILRFLLDNYENDIKLKFDDMEINVKDCDNDKQIKKYNRDGVLYCENPICKATCPTNTSAICLPFHKENLNDIEKNICECIKGWEGENCNAKKFIDFSKLLGVEFNLEDENEFEKIIESTSYVTESSNTPIEIYDAINNSNIYNSNISNNNIDDVSNTVESLNSNYTSSSSNVAISLNDINTNISDEYKKKIKNSRE
eukprot:jgi/Orpsp1_1/1187828/evm.model.d7180000060425.1